MTNAFLARKQLFRCALVVVALVFPTALTMAQDHPTDAQCRNFADFAVRNAQRVRDLNCTTLPWNDPTLSLDKGRHFGWCRMMRTETVEKMMEVLFAQSSKCEYCKSFAEAADEIWTERKVHLSEMENGRWGYVKCDYSDGVWGQLTDKGKAHSYCMASERVIGDSHHYDVASVKPQLELILGLMARELGVCKHRGRSKPFKTLSTSAVSAAPQCPVCHQRSTATLPAAPRAGPKRVSTDPTIARQPPAFTPFPERRRTPRDSDRSTSSGGSDQVAPRGAPSGGSSSAMDRLGGSGAGGAPSGGGQSGGTAAKPSGSGGGASSGPSSGGSSPNINSNTIKQQAPAFGQSPGLR